MEVTVVTGTYGDEGWQELAATRAAPSVPSDVPWVHVHADTLTDARNGALEEVDTEWVVHLDADDELSPGYLEAMAQGTADVRAPLALYVYPDGTQRFWQPRVWGHRHDCHADCLTDGNWILIGATVRTELLRAVGGWRDFAWSEDFDLWVRCWQAGATFELLPSAVYRAHVRVDSRNRGATAEAKLEAHRAIAVANGLPVP